MHVARNVADICREGTEEVNRYRFKRKRVKADEEGTSAPSSDRTWMDVSLDADESSLWSSAVEPTDDSEGYNIYVKWNGGGRLNLYELEAAFIRRLKRSLDAAGKRIKRHATEFAFNEGHPSLATITNIPRDDNPPTP
ncbi:unnamed protein product [Schistocephalus solidus]|uniref:Chromo domain-containing protein n=1 Tax=Schistocephalus solidus TaxID=70667 RepID=A0A183S9L7_SCHSO|nr:unnamed protein product [Schistocephalus solidus]